MYRLTLLMFCFFHLSPAAAQVRNGFAETLFYADMRIAAQADSRSGSMSGLRNYSSRAGVRVTRSLSVPAGAWHGVFHGELGLNTDTNRLGADGTRLLYAGIQRSGHQLTFGKQWSAFYNTVGWAMEAGFLQSGFGYEGAEQFDRTLQYAFTDSANYLQVDVVMDNDHDARSPNRIAVGLQHREPAWHAGIALDMSRHSKRTLSLVTESSLRENLCNHPTVNCLGAVVGWRRGSLSLDVGAVRAFSGAGKSDGASITANWDPNQFGYYVELSGQNIEDGRSRSLAAGLRYRFNDAFSGFIEMSNRRLSRARGNSNDAVVAAGLRWTYNSAF